MVATLVRLRAAVLVHTVRREVWRAILLVGGVVWMLAAVPSVVAGMLWLSRQPGDVAHDVLVIGGALLVLGWAVVPVLVPGMDDTLDIRRFATLGVPARRLVPGLLAAGLLGVPTIATAGLGLAPVLAWSGPAGGAVGGDRSAWPAVVALAAAPLVLATCMLAARTSTAAAGRLLGSRRSREIAAVLGLLVVVAAVPAALSIGALGLEGALEQVPAVAQVLAWTPFGAAWSAPAAMAAGDVLGAVLRLLTAAAWVAAGLALWTRQLGRALVSPPAQSGQVRRRADALIPDRSPTTHRAGAADRLSTRASTRAAMRAVTLRCLRYWTGDPRYLSAMLAAVGMSLVLVLLVGTVVDAPAAIALAAAPLMAGTIGWGRHNDVAFDGSAFWMHVVAAVPGRVDRAGRALATVLWAAPVTVVVAVVGAHLGGRLDLAPAAAGAGFGVLGVGLGVSAVSSAVLVYPVPAAGENPYSAQAGALGAVLVAQLVTSAATLALSLPVLVLFGAALWWQPALAWPVLALGLLLGAGVLAAGVRLGGTVLERRAPRLLARLG